MNTLEFVKPQILKEDFEFEPSENDSVDEKIFSMDIYRTKEKHKFIDGNDLLYVKPSKKKERKLNDKSNRRLGRKYDPLMQKQIQRCSSLDLLKRKIIQESKLNFENMKAKKKAFLEQKNFIMKTCPKIVQAKNHMSLGIKDMKQLVSDNITSMSKEKERFNKSLERDSNVKELLKETLSSEIRKINDNSSSNIKDSKM